jgi:dipeptidyl aminopeptidase/acylaminoacyl peptidase
MRPHDIGLLASAGEVTIDPSGERIVYTLTTTDLEANASRTRLWLATGDGAPRPLSGGAKADILPRWSPDGTLLAWVSVGDHGPSIRVLNVDGPGEAAVVCSWPDDITELAWAPTGDRLAFVGRVRDPERYGAAGTTKGQAEMPPRRVTRLMSRHDGDGWVFDRPTHVHVVPLDGSAPALALTSGEAPAHSVTWSPDADQIAYVSGTHDSWDLDGCTDVWVVAASGGEAMRLTDSQASWGYLSWSPDGTRLAGLVNPSPMVAPRHGQLWVLRLDDPMPVRWAAGMDRNLAPYGAARPPLWAGDEVIVGAEDHGSLHLYAAGDPVSAGDQPRLVLDGQRIVRSYDGAAGRLAFTASTATEPGELWLGDVAGSAARKLSDHSSTLRSRVELVVPERFTATSADGTEVECWAMAPVGAEAGARQPTVLNIHGGPFTQYGVGFFDEFQLQVGAGLGVVYCNPRGSSGYEEAWGRAIRWPEASVDPGSGWGGVDYDDVMACVDEAVRRFPWVDADRLGVQGGSYGGYLTSWIVGHTDRFKAAVSERAVNNLVTMEHNSDISGFFKADVGWSHLERPDLYMRQSPATYVEAMTTPMLLVHSEDDLRCPISQAEELFVALRLLGRHPELVRFPGECHELSRSGSPKHRVMRAELILEWFERHLLPAKA